MSKVLALNGSVNNQSQIEETFGNSNIVMNPLFRLVEKLYGIIDIERLIPDSIMFMRIAKYPLFQDFGGKIPPNSE